MSQEDVNAIILSPRQVATGDPAGNALENVNTNVLGDGALCYVETGVGQGEWQLQKASTLPAGLNVVVPTAGPGRWLLMGSAFSPVPVPSTEVEEIWVDGTNGTTNGTGTEADPFLTFAQVALRIGTQAWHPMVVHLLNAPPGGFIMAELAGWRAINAPIVFIGEGDGNGNDVWEELYPPTLIDSVNDTLITCTTAAPGWTVERWANSCHAEIIRPDGTSFGFYSVMDNTADALNVGAPKTTDPPAGSSVRIVRAATTVLVEDYTTTPTRIQGGVGLVDKDYSGSIAPRECVHWVNIKFAGVYYPSMYLTGAHNFVGCAFVGIGTAVAWLYLYGQITSGRFDTCLAAFGFDANYCVGNGLVVGSEQTTALPSRVTLYGGLFAGSLTCWRILCLARVDLFLADGWRIRSSTIGTLFCLYAAEYDTIRLWTVSSASNGVSYAGLGQRGAGDGSAYLVEIRRHTTADVRGTITLYGTCGGFFRANDMSTADFVCTLIPDHPNFIIRTGLGSIITLYTRDYAELGAATIGSSTVVLTRPKGAWNIGDSVIALAAGNFALAPRDGMPCIFRVS